MPGKEDAASEASEAGAAPRPRPPCLKRPAQYCFIRSPREDSATKQRTCPQAKRCSYVVYVRILAGEVISREDSRPQLVWNSGGCRQDAPWRAWRGSSARGVRVRRPNSVQDFPVASAPRYAAGLTEKNWGGKWALPTSTGDESLAMARSALLRCGSHRLALLGAQPSPRTRLI